MDPTVSTGPTPAGEIDSAMAWAAMSGVFGALGGAFLCLDADFRVLHASSALDDLLGDGAAMESVGRHAQDVLGSDLFGPDASFRLALSGREQRATRRPALSCPGHCAGTAVAVTAAPITPVEVSWDPRVSYVVMLHPVDEPAPPTPAQRLREILEAHRWRRMDAARALGVSRTTLWRMMREAGIAR